MSTQTSSRPVGVDELKRAWNAVTAGEFRAGVGQRLGNAPGNRLVVRQPHDKAAFAGHQRI